MGSRGEGPQGRDGTGGREGVEGRGAPGRLTARLPRVAAVVLAALVAVGVVVALFAVGLRVGGGSGATEAGGTGTGSTSPAEGVTDARQTPSPAATPSPVPTTAPAADTAQQPPQLPPAPAAPAAPGDHAWSDLFGGECLGTYTSPWEERFTVVDCATPHPAQVVTRGLFPEPAGATYPGEAELGARLNTLCTAPSVLNTAAASDVADLRWQGSFPATDADWAAGDRVYYCFFTTASGAPLSGTLVPAA
ncbi:hypothetical protein [Herbiconiux liangxiaofengii]|uniref:hypothetical protein n=1 Tax=Herbiconiux liangxiaofengii TaxID=3342795 RepID=UPI0035B9A50A